MPWDTIVEVKKPDELQTAQPLVAEVPVGTKIRIEVHGWGLGKLADMLGVENIAQQLAPSGFIVTDVFGTGWSMGTIEGTAGEDNANAQAIAPQWIFLVVAFLGAAAALLWGISFLITSIKVKGENIKIGGGDGLFGFLKGPLMLIAVGGVIYLVMKGRGKS